MRGHLKSSFLFTYRFINSFFPDFNYSNLCINFATYFAKIIIQISFKFINYVTS